MKRLIFSLAISLTALLVAAEVVPTKFWVWAAGVAHEYAISSEELVYSDGSLSIGSDVYSLSEVDSITFRTYENVEEEGEDENVDEEETVEEEEEVGEEEVEEGEEEDVDEEEQEEEDEEEQEEEDEEEVEDSVTVVSDTVFVTYNGSEAEVSALPSCVEAEIEGADVSLTNSDTSRELCFVLSGSSSCGSFVYNGSYKTTIMLNGLTLTGSSAEAINIKDGKRIALVLADGTQNTLEDASEDGGQKAAFYTKGHLEISGGGSLSLKGNAKHALSSKEYLLVKKTVGSITVTSAANDGIHAGQYVQVNGGTITVSGVGGDGIQAEMEEDGTEDDGKIIIKGGTLDISISSDDCAALKSDSTLHIKDGDITLRSTGSDDKGLKSKQNVSIEGGTLRVTQSGSYLVEDGEASYTTAIKADGDVSITGGEISITNSADAGKGISADGDISISEDDSSVTLTISCTGIGEALDESKTAGSGSSSQEEESYKVYVNVPSSTSNNGGGGPGGGSSGAWSNVYLYTSSGTKVAQLTSTATLTSGNTSKTFYVYDFGQADSGTYYFASDSYQSMGDRQTYSIKSGTFTGPSSGSPCFYVISSSYSTSGSTRTYTISDQTSTYSSYTISSTSGSSSSETVAPTCLKTDGSLSLLAGTITLSTTGSGAKGVKCDGQLTIGNEQDGTGPQLTITTTGSRISTSSSSTGNTPGGMGGMGGEDSSGTAAKAIKALGNAYVWGGTMEISTSQDGAEGLESKQAIYIEGGQNYLKCYDDCINASGCIYFDGGVTVCYSNGNDGVDSNAGTRGGITIGDGALFAYSTKGDPEEAVDCDNPSYIQITGTGVAITAGGRQSTSSATISNAAQGYAFVTSSVTYQAGRYYTLADSSGNNLATFAFSTSVSSSLSLFTATGMTSGSTYTIKYSTSEPTDATTAFHGLYLGSSATGTSSVLSFTAK